jgi:fibrillarin-like pre-rRNA processing protein
LKKLAIKIEKNSKIPEIYWVTLENGAKRVVTKNFFSGTKVYGERLVKHDGEEYRIWDPFRSKMAAAILKGLGRIPIQPGQKILYLGAGSGTTASHISDIVGKEGHIYCIEFSPRSIKKLLNICMIRSNMSPILADARLPEQYLILVERVDTIYCDIAQPEQAKVLADNADLFLKSKGWVLFTIKARSIDVTKKPLEIFERENDVLKARGFIIENVVNLEPYEKAHAMTVAQKL